MLKLTCAVCRRKRPADKLMDDRVVCKDRATCNRIAANAMIGGPSPAQMEALRLSGKSQAAAF